MFWLLVITLLAVLGLACNDEHMALFIFVIICLGLLGGYIAMMLVAP